MKQELEQYLLDTGIKMMSDSRYFEGEHEVIPVHAMKTYREKRGMAPPIINLGTKWR